MQKVDIKAFRWLMESQKLALSTDLIKANSEYMKDYIQEKLNKVNFCLSEIELFLNNKQDLGGNSVLKRLISGLKVVLK